MKALKKDPRGEWGWNRAGRGTHCFLSALFLLLSILTVLPLLFVFIVSLSSESSIAAKGYSFFPAEWSLDAYRYLLRSIDYIGHSFLLSTLLTVAGTLLSLLLISTMAFVLSRREFRFRKLYTALVLIPMFFSGGLAATYVVNTQLFGLKNTFWALLLPGACSSWYILVMRTYFRQNIPREILESAQMDGASILRIFFQFVIPLSRPILITVGLLKASATGTAGTRPCCTSARTTGSFSRSSMCFTASRETWSSWQRMKTSPAPSSGTSPRRPSAWPLWY